MTNFVSMCSSLYYYLQDTGIGMTKEDMIDNLGTIAKSGTKGFMEAIKAGDVAMIGQFGVGFYSAYLVADKVVVHSKNNDDEQHCWTSEAGSSFNLRPRDDNDAVITRGTKIVLHLKEDQLNFLEENCLKNLVQKHSEYIGFPISLQVMKTENQENEYEDSEDDSQPKMRSLMMTMMSRPHSNGRSSTKINQSGL
jgi:molecular chaperone HtpG